MPTQINPKPAINERYLVFIYWEKNEPTSTAIPDAAIRAQADPRNTVSLPFVEPEAYRSVAICVLSPSSAMNIVENTVISNFISIGTSL